MKNLLILLLSVCSLFAEAQIQQQSSFENALPTGWQGASNRNYSPFALIEGSETWSVAISNTYKVSGNTSWRGELRPGDRPVFYGNPRVELSVTSKGTAPTYQQNTFRMSTYIPTGVWAASSAEEVFPFQFHPWVTGYNGGSPSLAVETKNDRYRVMVRHTNGSTSTGATQVFYPNGNGTDIGPVVRGAWVHWIVYYVPRADASGRIVIWKKTDGADNDYVQVFAYTGRNLHGWSSYPFLKVGVYKWNNPSSGAASTYRTYYMDMVAFGTATEATAVNTFRLSGTVPPPNQPPTVSVGANASYIAGTTSAPLDATATDPEGQSMTYSWIKTSGGSVVINNSTTKNATVTGMTDNNTYSFQFTATDAQGAATTASKSITIAAANVPPTVTMGSNQNLSQGASTGTITATSADSDGTLSSGTWSQLSGPNTAGIANPNDASPGSSSTGLTGLITGTYTFKYQVVDNNGAIASGTVNVTVPAVNVTPVVTPNPPYILLNSATSTTISATSTDQDGTISTRLWTQLSGPNTATIVSSSSASTVVSGLIVGTYIFLHTATDNSGGQGSATVTVEVNNPPVVDFSSIVDFTFDNNTTSIGVTASATDADGTVVSYLWSAIEGPSTPTFTPSNTGNTTITNIRPGSYIVRLTVTDNDGAESSSDYSFTIEAKYIITKFGVKKVLKH